MSFLQSNYQDNIQWLTFNRVEKHNAFDNVLLNDLLQQLKQAECNPDVHIIVIRANGKHFSAGADLNWMQSMIGYTESENKADAMVLAQTLYQLYQCSKPTIAMVHGAAMGGGAGIVAACDIAIASSDAQFCFSEVKLGLIPAVISPYVVRAIGERAAAALFMTAEHFHAEKALSLGLIQYHVAVDSLQTFTHQLATQMTKWPHQAMRDAKSLVRRVAGRAIDASLQIETADLIAKKRISPEAQQALQAFLLKNK